MKLHLGCGEKFIEGMVHVDVVPAPHVDIVSDVASLDQINSNSCELIYACHVLEHFGRHEFKDVLREWYRVLKPGGVLRLAVPNFAACVNYYHRYGLEAGLSGLIGLICGGQRNLYDFHKMIFDEPFLRDALLDCGFREVRQWDWRDVEHGHIDDYSQAYLPHMDKEHGDHMSLNVEATK